MGIQKEAQNPSERFCASVIYLRDSPPGRRVAPLVRGKSRALRSFVIVRSFYLRVFASPFGAAPRRDLSRTSHPIPVLFSVWDFIVSYERGKSKEISVPKVGNEISGVLKTVQIL
jgi:hypothetical protein